MSRSFLDPRFGFRGAVLLHPFADADGFARCANDGHDALRFGLVALGAVGGFHLAALVRENRAKITGRSFLSRTQPRSFRFVH